MVRRIRSGWLSHDSLKAGERDQYAVMRSYGTYTLDLSWDAERECYLITQTTTKDSVSTRIVTPWTDITKARKQFNKLVREHP